ncbi:MAG: hypothetical protein QXP70_01670 [Methanomassiliicoccales archaeon]
MRDALMMAIKGKGDEWIYVYAIRSDGMRAVRTVSIAKDRIFCDCPVFDRLATCEHLEKAWKLHCRDENRNKHLGIELLPEKKD